jgi:hypothetical protein
MSKTDDQGADQAGAEQGGGLIPRESGGPVYRPDSDPKAGWASWDVTTDEGFSLLQRVQYGETMALADHLGQRLEIEHFYVKPNTSVNETTGEVVTYPLTFLVCADGNVYTAGSNGVFDSLRDLYRWKGKPPWTPPLPVECRAKKLGGGHRYFYLLYAPAITPATKKGGKNGA